MSGCLMAIRVEIPRLTSGLDSESTKSAILLSGFAFRSPWQSTLLGWRVHCTWNGRAESSVQEIRAVRGCSRAEFRALNSSLFALHLQLTQLHSHLLLFQASQAPPPLASLTPALARPTALPIVKILFFTVLFSL